MTIGKFLFEFIQGHKPNFLRDGSQPLCHSVSFNDISSFDNIVILSFNDISSFNNILSFYDLWSFNIIVILSFNDILSLPLTISLHCVISRPFVIQPTCLFVIRRRFVISLCNTRLSFDFFRSGSFVQI